MSLKCLRQVNTETYFQEKLQELQGTRPAFHAEVVAELDNYASSYPHCRDGSNWDRLDHALEFRARVMYLPPKKMIDRMFDCDSVDAFMHILVAG